MKFLDGGAKKDAFNSLIYWLCRPYVLLLAAAFLLMPSVKLVQALESGADFLNIGVSARASALGSAYTALAAGSNAIYYNPGGLGLAKREVSLMHSAWALDGSYDFAAAAFPVAGFTGAVSFTRLDHGGLDGRGPGRESSGGFSAADKAVGFGLARTAGGFSLGVGAKYLSSSIAGYEASSMAFDVGAVQKLNNAPVTLGLSVRNMGRGLKFIDKRESLPLTVSAGAAVAVLSSISLAAEVSRLMYDRRTSFAVGTEYGLTGNLALRGGYAAGSDGAPGAMTGGVGFSAGSMKIDYSFSPFGEMDTTKKFSLSMSF
ncbi:MAG: hypothetical protein A2X35_00445 [Elusimicrobia bacterium GWA2_61_42]|nr:MAG: hypothetical protein A2X35_00445 [Elusimicrobia bacterium GWA2_61_42]OGR79196.1 MAG: hypothetical protein A2X38_06560 [Elusimicrobia bacterium GWC2_61_25]